MNWAVHIFTDRHYFVGVVYVRTREDGRRLCRTLAEVGCHGFVTRPDAWRERAA